MLRQPEPLHLRGCGVFVQTWEELKASTGLDVPQLMVKKLPSTLRMDIKGQRDWFREQHSYLRYARNQPPFSRLPATSARVEGKEYCRCLSLASVKSDLLDSFGGGGALASVGMPTYSAGHFAAMCVDNELPQAVAPLSPSLSRDAH